VLNFLFGPPNVAKLKAKRHVKGLLRALTFQHEWDSSIPWLILRYTPLLDAFSYRHQWSNYDVREEAAKALGELGDAIAVEPLIQTLQDKYPSVRLAAVGALERILGQRAAEPLAPAIHDKSAGVQLAAVKALGRIRSSVAVEKLLAAELQGGFGDEAHEAAIQVIREVGSPSIIETLRAALKDVRVDVRDRAVEVLTVVTGDASVVAPLIEILKDKHSSTRYSAIWALRRIGDARAIEPLATVLCDPSDRTHEKAFDALRSDVWKAENDRQRVWLAIVGQNASELIHLHEVAIEPLIHCLRLTRCGEWPTDLYDAVLIAIDVLGQIGDERAIVFLANALEFASGLGEFEMRIVQALIKLGGGGWAMKILIPKVRKLTFGGSAYSDNARMAAGKLKTTFVELFDQAAQQIELDALEELACLPDFKYEVWQSGDYDTGFTYRECREDCSAIRELAHRELARRRLSGSTPAESSGSTSDS
jgi:HEAT repeat protein